MDESLRQAVLGAQNIGTPTSTLGAPAAPEIAQLYSSSFQLPQSTQAAGALVQNAGDVLQAQRSAASSSAKKGKYQKIRKDDGGFAFVDENGNEISAADYAQATGTTLDKLLSDSDNPIDIGFVQDYQALRDYINNKFNSGSESARAYAKKVEDQVKNQYNVDLGSLTPQAVLDKFREQYPTVFGRTNRGVPVGQQFIPSLSAKDVGSSGYGLSSNYSL